MVKTTLFHIIAIGLLLAACVRIPEQHGTAGNYNGPGAPNTECFSQDSILAHKPPAAAQQLGGLNSLGFRVLNWNSYKGSNKIWQEDLERLSSLSDLVLLQEG
ncbi:MAG: hypothetical protein WBF36_09990 [Desulfobulbales bacterium]